jgi:hypothetical protein
MLVAFRLAGLSALEGHYGQGHASVAFDMPFPFADFPLLFTSEWPARGLDDAIASLSVEKLVTEYNGVRECAPQRGLRGKSFFVRHIGSTPGGSTSNRREEHMARALCVLGRRWPWPGGGSLRLLDYQVPLKARQDDAGIGKIDLLGVTEVGEVGRFVVVELKIDHAGGGLGDSPPAALMEALRYAAIFQHPRNHSDIADEAKRKFNAHVDPDDPDKDKLAPAPSIMLLGTAEWWQSWITLKALARGKVRSWAS